jgi:predicted DNA-binding transcriptional regulator YafY
MLTSTMKDRNAPRDHLRTSRRLWNIHKSIASGSYPNAKQLAAREGVDVRTIRRAIAFLRDEYDAPVRHDRKKGGYRYTVEGWTLPHLKLTEGELLAFFIAENALKFTGHTPEALVLRESLGKIAALLPGEVSVNLATLGENVSFQNLPFPSVEPEMLKSLALAAVSRRTVEFDYYSPHKQEKTHRTASIHLLHNFAGDWFAVSYDHRRRDFRDFHAGRLENLRETNEEFRLQKSFNAEDYLKRGFHMMRGGRLTTVRIRFDAFRSQWIRERKFFHPDERREDHPDGSLSLSFKIGEKGLEAVARFCLTYSGHCRVEKPKKLIEIVRKKLKRALELHL